MLCACRHLNFTIILAFGIFVIDWKWNFLETVIMDALRVHAKNGRITLDERLILLLGELSMMTWDIICFSETRLQTRDEFIEGRHRLISFNDKNARTPATGVAILAHRRWTGQIKQIIYFHDRVIAIALKLPPRMVRILAVYLPNAWNYDLIFFQSIFEEIERLSMEAMDNGYALIIADDFNLSLEQ